MLQRFTPTLVLCLLGSAAAVAALGLPGGDDAGDAVGDTDGPTIEIVDFTFAGDDAVVPGAELDVVNGDGAAHTLTASAGAFDTGVVAGGDRTAITAPGQPGTYEYFCAIHPSMTGSLVVG